MYIRSPIKTLMRQTDYKTGSELFMNAIAQRTETEMFSLILDIAKKDDRIRAVYMNGSRANPNINKDMLQDYDIVYVVNETASFINDKAFIKQFGETAIVQEPDSNNMAWGENADTARSYTWLMLFKDKNRIDLHIEIPEVTKLEYGTDSLTVPLLDKEGILKEIPPPTDRDYYIKKPAKEQFAGCCNEFWWCLNNVAKGIKRDQLPYALRMYVGIVHIELEKMVEWDIAIRHDFAITTGMWGKYFKEYLSSEAYSRYMKTYPNGGELKEAIQEACALFSELAKTVSNELGYPYNTKDEEGMLNYLEKMLDISVLR